MVSKDSFPRLSDRLIGLGLFVVALAPRALALGAFVTADEAKWVYRSARFLAALLQGDLAATVVNLTPAVTTTWLGSIGLSAYYALFRPAPDFAQWLLSLPEFRADLDVLVAVRWPMVILTSAGVVLFYQLARRLTDRPTALIFGLLLALDPQFLALSRLLGHDAPAGLFVGLSLLAWLAVMRRPSPPIPRRGARGEGLGFLLLSAVFAGLALLSKSPAFFLLPFVGLAWLVVWLRRRPPFGRWLLLLAIWLAVAAVTFTLLWPAAWQQPLLTPWSVINNAFLSATDTVEAAAEGYWMVPDLGFLYYPINAGFKLSIAASLGLLAWLALVLSRRGRESRRGQWATDGWLLAFVLLFTLFMTLGGKRSSRYLLPAWPALYLLAAVGLRHLPGCLWPTARNQTSPHFPHLEGRGGKALVLCFVVGFLALLLPLTYTFPYYLSYYNPFLGGPWTAPHLVKIGWGEGLDRAGRWLNSQPDAPASRVGSAYTSALAPFFPGSISPVTAESLDYVVLYAKQVQAGEPSPSILRYYDTLQPVHTISLAGMTYARIFPGPAVRPALSDSPPHDIGILPKPLAFRLGRSYLPIGGETAVEVLWLAADDLPLASTRLTLAPVDDLEAPPGGRSGVEFAAAEAQLERTTGGVVLSRYQLTLPAELARSDYGLLVDGRPLGPAPARLFDLPPESEALGAVFGDQLALAAYSLDAPANELVLMWQAAPKAWADYTIFVHLLDGDGERVTGVDVQPQPPASAWVRGEVVVLRYGDDSPYGPLLPTDLPSGEYRAAVGLYAPDTGQRLSLPDGADLLLLPESVRVE